MKAQILYGIGNIKYTEVEVPTPKDNEALIRVSACGICGSDIPRIYKTGAHNMPLVPGHEMTGMVKECAARPELVGRRVGIFPLIPCKECPQCKTGHYEMCENYNYLGSRCDGGFAELVTVPVWNLIPLPDDISDDEAAMLEPMCVAVHAIREIGLIRKITAQDGSKQWTTVAAEAGGVDGTGSQPTIAVCGLGTIGLFVAMFLKDAGYRNVFCIGNKNIQKKKLLEMGYEEGDLCDVRYAEPATFIKEKTGGAGVDYYFECIGRPESYEQAIKCAAPLGRVMLVGNPAADMDLPREIYWKILRGQLTLKGTWNSSYPDDWTYVVERLTCWKKLRESAIKPNDELCAMDPSSLITHRFNLEDMDQGLSIMKNKSEEYIKVMVNP
ncbi:MAG: galactitol-1-phosphate 5-dehydrogenase [Butyrivibrio sp.]|nr:galactitol-1-phosphate 5-dehydrogenase [Butyrivibrio sp.]MBR1642052.1 galactitol-1-phosphate 5-dehydrogenase [Butyrivibrio sp.]